MTLEKEILDQYYKNIKICTDFAQKHSKWSSNLEISLSPDHYSIAVILYLNDNTYCISTIFSNTGFDTRVEVLEKGNFCNFIEFEHEKTDLDSVLLKAKELLDKKILTSKN